MPALRRPQAAPGGAVGLGLLAVLLLLTSGCGGGREVTIPPDERYGHRYDGPDSLGRPTLDIEPPRDGVAYFYYPAYIDSVHIRPALPAPDTATGLVDTLQTVPVEVLVKGVFYDACLALHELEQDRTGNFVSVTITMRRRQQAVCTSQVIPYRFYFPLEGTYRPGAYQLRLNGTVYPFVVAPPSE